MAVLDSLRSWLGLGTRYENVEFYTPHVSQIMGMGPEELYRTQPHLRTVVSFLARNIAQLPLQGFQRAADNDRHRITDGPLGLLLKQPNPSQTMYELLYATVSDLKLYDYALWSVTEASEDEARAGWQIRAIPPSWITGTGGGTAWEPSWVRVANPSSGKVTVLEQPDFLVFHGWRPGSPSKGASPVDALREILTEQIQAWSYRQQIWQRGGRVGTVITRPATSAQWSAEAREKFSRDWKAKWTGHDGPKAGGTPILEDGMDLKRIGFSAREDEWSEVAKLSLATVAAVYHTSPTMVGILDNANFSNVKEFSRMLYTDTLGPDLAMLEQRINAFVVPRISERDDVYVEFNMQAKLAGSFEEQAAVISTSVGRPWMTADEARARFNMPALGGDAELLVTPLNVLVGGQASPQDGTTAGGGGSPLLTGEDLKQRVEAAAALIRSGFDPAGALVAVGLDPIKHLGLLPVTVQKPVEPTEEVDESIVDAITRDGKASKAAATLSRSSTSDPLKVKSGMRVEDEKAATQVMTRFFKRQRQVVLSALGSKDDADWWDADRWDAELSDDLYALAMTISQEIAADVLTELGIEPDLYDTGRTAKFLRAVADSRAGAINSTTRDQIKAALADELDDGAEKSTPAGVFDVAESSRAEQAGATLATTLAGFAVTEAASQLNRPRTTKTWVVTSANPRPSHAAMNGETVAMNEDFSNGAPWPGSAVLDVDEVAGCSCVVEITIP